MVTLDEFVGALLSGITRARALSDGASVHVAEQYAQHELLKGFPIPRMTIQNMEVEVTFAVSSKSGSAAALHPPEAQTNLTYRLREMLEALPEEARLREYIGKGTKGEAAWRGGVEKVTAHIKRILASPATDVEQIIGMLTMTIVNYLYESVGPRARAGFFVEESSRKSGASVSAFIEGRVRAQLAPLMASKPGKDGGSSGLQVLVSAAELEGLNPASFHKVKLAIASSDRKWVTAEKDGEKTRILDRS